MIIMPVNTWTSFKTIVIDNKKLDIQFTESSDKYEVFASDAGAFVWNICLLKDSGDDVTDFETNYKDSSNKKIDQSVKTQFERDDLILKIACGKADVDINSEALIDLLVPGVLAEGGGRYVSGGHCFFDSPLAGDKITEICVIDKDDVLGYGANTVVQTYHDEDVDSDNKGWYISPQRPLEVETLGFYGFIPSELYLRIKGKRSNSVTTGKLFTDIEWGVIG